METDPPTHSSAPSDLAEEATAVVLLTSHSIAHSVAAIVFALHHSQTLLQPILPHYQLRDILHQTGILHCPRISSDGRQHEIDRVVHRVCQEEPSPAVFQRLVDKPHRFYRLTRLSLLEFIILYLELEKGIRAPYTTTDSSDGTSRRRRLHPIDQFLLWLWHGDGNDVDVLALLFDDISRSTANRIADHVTNVVNTVWADEVSWPDADERRALYGFFSSCKTAVGVLDGTHCQIEVPVIDEGEFHSQYKKFHTQLYLICADALGFVIWMDGPFGGHDSDRTVFNSTPFAQRECPLLSPGEVLLVDGGFKGEGHILHQFTLNELAPMTEEDRVRVAAFNEDFTHNRSPIEHCIHRVKSRMQALAKRWPRAREKQGGLFNAAVKVYNRCRSVGG